jgi:hypothetical protein
MALSNVFWLPTPTASMIKVRVLNPSAIAVLAIAVIVAVAGGNIVALFLVMISSGGWKGLRSIRKSSFSLFFRSALIGDLGYLLVERRIVQYRFLRRCMACVQVRKNNLGQ